MTCFTKKPRSLLLEAALLEIKSCVFFERKVDSIASKWLHPKKTNIYQLSYPLCCAISLYLSSLEALQNNILLYTFRFALLGSHPPFVKLMTHTGTTWKDMDPWRPQYKFTKLANGQYQRPGNRKVPRYKKSKTKPLVNPQALKSLICGCGARLSMVPVISKVTGNHWVNRSLSVSISKSWRIGSVKDAGKFNMTRSTRWGPGAGLVSEQNLFETKKRSGFFLHYLYGISSLPCITYITYLEVHIHISFYRFPQLRDYRLSLALFFSTKELGTSKKKHNCVMQNLNRGMVGW